VENFRARRAIRNVKAAEAIKALLRSATRRITDDWLRRIGGRKFHFRISRVTEHVFLFS
jgi:hypothetical protein